MDLKNYLSGTYDSNDFSFEPTLFDIDDPNSRDNLILFIDKNKNRINVFSTIENQLKELIKINSPKQKFSEKELKKELNSWRKERGINFYGTWVYYPWNQRLVHLLPKTDFIRLRTSRNQYKITPMEQLELESKKVGVIGLSVGQSVALTMAMERVAGTLRLADFDHLDLSNLNRIRSPLSNLGLPKTIMVAREIAEIDPFLKVELFPEGITDHNLEQFLGDGADRLDLLVE